MVGYYLAFSLLPLLGFNENEVIKLMSFQELNPVTTLKLSANESDLLVLSSSALQAESWLKSQFLLQKPPSKITQIEVGKGVLCNKTLEPMWSSVLPSVKNMHSTLSEWGIEREVEISVSLTSDYLDKELVKPLLSFVKDFNLSCFIDETSSTRVIEMKPEAKAISRKITSLSF